MHQPQPRWNVTVSVTSSTTETRLASSAPRTGDHAGRMDRSHALRRDLFRPDPDDGGRDQLQIRYQTGRQVHRADLRAVAELQHGGDQADSEREQLVDVVQIGLRCLR